MIFLRILQAVVLFGATQIMPDHVSIAAPVVSMARTGVCPRFETPECPYVRKDFCTADSDCGEGLMCCDIGCENYCVVPDVSAAVHGHGPTYPPNTSIAAPLTSIAVPDHVSTAAPNTSIATPVVSMARTGLCPVFETRDYCPYVRKDFCTADSDCVEGLKCCDIGGCNNDCVVPDQVSTDALNMSTAVPDQVSTDALNMSTAAPVQEATTAPDEVSTTVSGTAAMNTEAPK